ncbi:hypothetical protein RAE19_19040 [Rhodoferax sp. TBRC 17660]|uniref:Flagellar hook-length control protein-like C-terminal domain-containing protein n=1 Tax=Rhodoferax potami TaxID=3068338 RepID=A0ABU3KSE7_9BURK|nr:hypothetical protein [Rhodoferax sp. TBRC 17660]MDT7520740.1 hypothetical protein [Rhodoferax sp. TBRC 17660]
MKVEAQRTEARTQRARELHQRDVADDDKARSFKKQLQRRHDEEMLAQTAIGGAFELMDLLRQREPEPALQAAAPMICQDNALPTDALARTLPSEPVVDADAVQARMQDSVRLDTLARAAVDAGLKASMTQGSSEYQVELGSTFFVRTRLRVRTGDNHRLEVRCESDSASEREWFGRNHEALVGRISGLTGRDVQLDIQEPLV